MAPLRNAAWLTEELSKALGWDTMVIEGVVAAIANAQTDEEVQELVANFMGDNTAAAGLIAQFRQAQRSKSGSYSASVSSSSSSVHVAPPERQAAAPERDPQAGWVVYRKGEQEPLADEYTTGSKSAGAAADAGQRSPQPKAGAQQAREAGSPEPIKASSAAKQQAEATLAMFRKGGRLKASHAAGGGGSKRGEGGEGGPTLERQVVNCLSCGKVYDCRSFTNDIIRFLEKGGTCTFCGSRVALTYAERGTVPGQAVASQPPPAATASAGAAPAQAAAAPQATPAAPAVAAAARDAEAVAAAVAFKDRLVDYDRNSAKRTSVIDDQSDYFEIDANAWLTDEERSEMRERRRLEEEALQLQKSKRFTVTLDLIGRQVLLDNDPQRADGAAGAEQAAEPSTRASGAHGASSGAGQDRPSSSTSEGDKQANSGAPSVEAMAKALSAVRDMRIHMNPNLTTAPPVFIPRRQQRQQQQQQQQQQQASTGTSTATSSQQGTSQPMPKRTAPANSDTASVGPAPTQLSKRAAKSTQSKKPADKKARAKRHDAARMQADDVFGQFEASLLSDEFGGGQAMQQLAA